MSTEPEDGGDYGALDYRNIDRIRLGRYEFDTWFGNSALFLPNEPDILAYKALEQGIRRSNSHRKVEEHFKAGTMWLETLHVCPYCFKYTEDLADMDQHRLGCRYKTSLPGKVMYWDGDVTIRKVRAPRHKLFCQCLCLLAKFFLDNKSVFHNLDYYDFYVIYKTLDGVSTPMGFFSRELLSWDSNNLSCIMVIPCYQKQHLGTKLIDFSYHLSRYEQLISGPERPLSPLGQITFLRYWGSRLGRAFLYGPLRGTEITTLDSISKTMGFRTEDILLALDFMQCLYEAGKKTRFTDYYTERVDKETGDCEFFEGDLVFLTDPHYSLYIDKAQVRRWVVDNGVRDEPILKEDGLLLY